MRNTRNPRKDTQTDKTLQQHHSCPALGMHVLQYREGVDVHRCTAAGCSNTQGSWIRRAKNGGTLCR